MTIEHSEKSVTRRCTSILTWSFRDSNSVRGVEFLSLGKRIIGYVSLDTSRQTPLYRCQVDISPTEKRSFSTERSEEARAWVEDSVSFFLAKRLQWLAKPGSSSNEELQRMLEKERATNRGLAWDLLHEIRAREQAESKNSGKDARMTQAERIEAYFRAREGRPVAMKEVARTLEIPLSSANTIACRLAIAGTLKRTKPGSYIMLES